MKINGYFKNDYLVLKKTEKAPDIDKKEYSEYAKKEDDNKIENKEVKKTNTYRAFFDIDDKNNVVIKIVDSENNLIRQIPPEEYLKIKEALKQANKNLLHLEA